MTRPKRPPYRRSKQGRLVAGVCSSFARRWGWSPTIVRLLWLICTVIPVLPGLPVYLALWIFVPAE